MPLEIERADVSLDGDKPLPMTEEETSILEEIKGELGAEGITVVVVKTASFGHNEFQQEAFDAKRLVGLCSSNGILCTRTEGKKQRYDMRVKPSNDDQEEESTEEKSTPAPKKSRKGKK